MNLIDNLGRLLDQVFALLLFQVLLLNLCLGSLLSLAGCAAPITIRGSRWLDAVQLKTKVND